jgi:hypothetical protein
MLHLGSARKIHSNPIQHKLQYYGVQGITLDWFKSYLINRKQRVELKLYNTQNQFYLMSYPKI